LDLIVLHSSGIHAAVYKEIPFELYLWPIDADCLRVDVISLIAFSHVVSSININLGDELAIPAGISWISEGKYFSRL